MKASNHQIWVSGIDVQVVRKDIKNLHLAVYPPNGQVRVAAPYHVNDENVRLAVVSKLGWIKRQQKDFNKQARQTDRQFISGECHYFFGKQYRLEVCETLGKQSVSVKRSGRLRLKVRLNVITSSKEKLLNDWYRQQLKSEIEPLVEKWEAILGDKVAAWRVRKMKTKWGSCNIEQRRILLNLELAKKPLECLEYILLHEMLHFTERKHNERFKVLCDQHMPDWRARRALLNSMPLGHETWSY